MAYDEQTAERVRRILRRRTGVSERKMFGGLCFLVNGHMCCGLAGSDLVIRLGEEGTSVALTEPHTNEMDFTGKPMKSMIYVRPPGYASDDALKSWVDRAVKFVRSLPAKE